MQTKRRKSTRREIDTYLSMLDFAARFENAMQTDKQNAIVQQNNAKTPLKMSEKATNAANAETTANGTENSEKTATNGGFSFAKSFNKTAFDVDVTDFEYVKLAALYNADAKTVYRVDAMWVTKSPLGDSPVFVVSEIGKLVNMPSHLASTVRDILSSMDAVDAIKGGKVGFTVYEYESHGKKCYNVRFVDL